MNPYLATYSTAMLLNYNCIATAKQVCDERT